MEGDGPVVQVDILESTIRKSENGSKEGSQKEHSPMENGTQGDSPIHSRRTNGGKDGENQGETMDIALD